MDIRNLIVLVGTTVWSRVEATFQRFLSVVGGITGRLKWNFSSFSGFSGWTTAGVLNAYAVFKVQLYLYHFLVICSFVNYLRICSFSGHHIVNFSVMSNCNSYSSLQNIALTSGTDQVESINIDRDDRFSGHTPVDCSDRKDKLLPHYNVTNSWDEDGGAAVSTAQMPRKLFLT